MILYICKVKGAEKGADMATTESIFHVDGHTCAGGFVTASFETEEAALAFWGSDSDWQDGDLVEEIFESTKRSCRVIKRVGF
jgi:hypothetical protein